MSDYIENTFSDNPETVDWSPLLKGLRENLCNYVDLLTDKFDMLSTRCIRSDGKTF
jgi:hypothetical protein